MEDGRMQRVETWPTTVACRALALRWLGEVAAAAERLGTGTDSEALHDFRVGLRRLRVTLKVYRPWLEETVSAKGRKKLRRIARATGPIRDLEVQRAWLEAQELRSEAEAAARSDLLENLDEAGTNGRSLERALRRFRKQERRLSRELDHVNVRPLGSECPPPLFGPTTARVAAGCLDTLTASLSRIRCPEDDAGIHSARISTKRLRYLFEPFGTALPACASAFSCLGALQDALGDLRDVSLLGRRIDSAREGARGERLRAGYFLLSWRAARARLELFEALRRGWLHPGALDGSLAAIRVLAEERPLAGGPGTT